MAWDINKKRKENIEKNITKFTSKEIIEYENKYDEIIQKGLEQNKKTPSKYLREKKNILFII